MSVPSLLLLCAAALANKHTGAGLGRILERRLPYQGDLRWKIKQCCGRKTCGVPTAHYSAYDGHRVVIKKRKRGGFLMGFQCRHCYHQEHKCYACGKLSCGKREEGCICEWELHY